MDTCRRSRPGACPQRQEVPFHPCRQQGRESSSITWQSAWGGGRSREGIVRGARLTLFLPTLACLLHVPQAHLTFPIVGLRPDGAPSAQTLPGSTRPGDASQVPRTWLRLTCPACRERSTSPGMLTSVVPELTQSPRKLSRSPCPHS